MAQFTYEVASQQLPDAIYQQAAVHDLGQLVTVYKPRFSNPFFILVIALLIAAIDVAAVVALYYAGWVVYYLFAIPVIAIVWAANALFNFNLRVYLFANGFIRTRGQRGEAVRWDQVQAIWEKVTQTYYTRTLMYTAHMYTVQRSDGKVLKQGRGLQNSRDMGLRMMREIRKVLLPTVRTAYEAGQTLSFGPISVNMQGLSRGKELIPWSEVGSITLKQGTVCVEKNGRQLRWSSPVKAADVPNLSVLIALVNHVVQGQG